MRAQLFIAILMIPFVISSSGCKNAFEEFANKETDDALLFEANKLADKKDWTGAIEMIGAMSASARAKRETKLSLASFYAGRCGLDLIQMANDIKDGLTATARIFPVLSQTMPGSVIADADDCETAELTIQSISETATQRTSDENIVMALIEFAKIGAVLVSSGVDANADGAIDTNHATTCALTAVPSGQTVSPVQRLGAAITNVVASLSASGTSIGADAVNNIEEMCDDLEASVGAGFCEQYKPENFTGVEAKAIASLIQSNEIGFNSCGGTVDSAGCICP